MVERNSNDTNLETKINLNRFYFIYWYSSRLVLTDIYHYLIFKINVVFVSLLSYSNKKSEKNSKMDQN